MPGNRKTPARGRHPLATAAPDLPTIAFQEFAALLRPRVRRLRGLAASLRDTEEDEPLLTRPLVSTVLAETSYLEEILDIYGALNNSRWFLLREQTATAHNFAKVSCEILHIEHSFSRYRLLPVSGDFQADTHQLKAWLRQVLTSVLAEFSATCAELSLGGAETAPDTLREALPPGILKGDRRTRHEASARERVVSLATSFLELAVRSEDLHTAAAATPDEYAALLPDPISEESLRQLEYQFHNLQSLYDTHIAHSDAEGQDGDLPVLRGHVSMILHLTAAATILVHFHERHHGLHVKYPSVRAGCPLDFNQLLARVMDYCLAYASQYLSNAHALCQQILKRYAVITSVQVPVPPYRGFHVRPAALIAKVVRHYGSDVQMQLDEETYDAASALDLFRANELLNAAKRRHIADEIAELRLAKKGPKQSNPAGLVQRVIQRLAENKRIVVYEHPLKLEGADPRPDESPTEYVLEEITRLLAMGKLDILAKVMVTFTGDERVLRDLSVLADAGYCEDRFGNNVQIPHELRYLRHQ